MKTRNDILAEYVRKKYPEIERTLDFAVYSISESLKGLGVALKEAMSKAQTLEISDFSDKQHESD